MIISPSVKQRSAPDRRRREEGAGREAEEEEEATLSAAAAAVVGAVVGKMTWSTGDSYEGGFKDDLKHGQGTHETEEGTYVGEFQAGRRNGEGTMTWKNDHRYTGAWKDDKHHGVGKLVTGSDAYAGDWDSGKRDGQGTVTWSNGNSYSGAWQDNKQMGIGTYSWKEGGQAYTVELAGDKQNQMDANSPWIPAYQQAQFDVFLSHKQSDSADFCRALQVDLQSNRGLRVFLDQDDNGDIGTLMDRVRNSQNFLFVLSTNIFESPWCLKELRAAIAANRNVVLLTHPDARWADSSFPPASLIPSDVASAFHSVAVQFHRAYYKAGVDKLMERIQLQEKPKQLQSTAATTVKEAESPSAASEPLIVG